MIKLVIQTFGKESEYRRAILTVLSFYAHSKTSVNETMVIIFTDQPGYFEPYLLGLPIHYVLLTSGKIREMRGKIDFLHRMKISVIEDAFQLAEGNLLYADSDSFFINDPQPYMEQLDEHTSFMHTREYRFDEMKHMPLPGGAPFRAFYELIANNNFQIINNNSFNVPVHYSSWNAGVMMFHSSHASFIPDVYALTEQFYPSTGNHASEQYAFSVVLESRTKLQTCESVNYHYWYRVKKQIMDVFLEERLTLDWSKRVLEQKLSDVKNWCAMLPSFFDTHVLTYRDNAIQAFNEKKYIHGYFSAGKALLRNPVCDRVFIKDVLYHVKRHILGK